MASEPTWKSIAQQKQSTRTSLIPAEWVLSPSSLPTPTTLDVRSIPRSCGILTPKEVEITENYDAVSLSLAINKGTLTSYEVTLAFCKRAAIAHQLTNCLTEILFSSALTRASFLDSEYKKRGNKTVGPLHGIPISLKDTFKIIGYDSCIGIASLANKPAEENSTLVDILLEQGAVLYCKTNVPQTLMALDSVNNVFGRTMNPVNRRVTAGGSSGGEGALIAMRGGILGVGTDIGGSIRIPAMCGGLYGVKPSMGRVPFSGQVTGARKGSAKIGLMASAGPIATSLRDCEFFLKTVAGSRPWERDPEVLYGEWEEQGTLGSGVASSLGANLWSGKGMKKPLLGVIRTDGVTTPLPPITKIINETVGKLRSSGIEVIEIPAPAFKKCQSLTNKFFSINGANDMSSLLSSTSEPLIDWLSTRFKTKPPISLEKVVELHAKKIELEKEMSQIWKCPKTGRGIDAIICPVAPHPVPPIDRWNAVGYTSSWVLLDYPAGVVPVRDFCEGDLQGEVEGKVLGGWDRINRELWEEKEIDRGVYLGTKLSVQVVGRKLQERRLVRAMGVIDDVLRKGEKGNGRAKL